MSCQTSTHLQRRREDYHSQRECRMITVSYAMFYRARSERSFPAVSRKRSSLYSRAELSFDMRLTSAWFFTAMKPTHWKEVALFSFLCNLEARISHKYSLIQLMINKCMTTESNIDTITLIQCLPLLPFASYHFCGILGTQCHTL